MDNRMLDCQDFESRIQELLDSRSDIASNSLLAEHAAHCSSCDQLLQDYQQIELVFHSPIPEYDHWRKHSQYSQKRRPPIRRDPNRLSWACLAVAVLVLCGWFFQSIQLSSTNTVADRSFLRAPPLPQAEIVLLEEESSELDPVAQNVTTSTRAFASHTLWDIGDSGAVVELFQRNVAELTRVPQISQSTFANRFSTTAPLEIPVVRSIKRTVDVALEALQRSLLRPAVTSRESTSTQRLNFGWTNV